MTRICRGMRHAPRSAEPDSFAWSRMTVSQLTCACLLLALVSLLFAFVGGVEQQANALTGGDAERGSVSIRRYGCGSCHTISRLPGAHSKVGPDLSGLADRTYINDDVTKSLEHLDSWNENCQ